jgi:hypothetical protein
MQPEEQSLILGCCLALELNPEVHCDCPLNATLNLSALSCAAWRRVSCCLNYYLKALAPDHLYIAIRGGMHACDG